MPELGEIGRIIDHMERQHEIVFPQVDVKYSDNIHRACCVRPADPPEWFSEWARDDFNRRRHSGLRLRRLVEDEIREVDKSKYTVFVPRELLNIPVRLCATLWEELGHVTAWALGVEDMVLNESVALAYRFKGLLKGAEEGRFSLEEAIHRIEFDIKGAELDSYVISKIERMRFIKASTDDPMKHYHKALFAVREFNPQLMFRNRDSHELMAELDKIIGYTLAIDRRRKSRFRRRLIPTVVVMAMAWLIFFYALSFFGK